MQESYPLTLALPTNTVHVWQVALDCSPAAIQRLANTLSTDEIHRATRFYFERDRRRFMVSRGTLRTILAAYSSVPPEQLRFHYGPQGKPELVAVADEVSLRFNLAHSHELALIAVTRGRELGVDLEWIRPLPAAEAIAGRFFSPNERTVLRALNGEQQQLTFFTCWTRKEAYLKARGDGLSLPLDQFDVALAPDEPAALLRVCGDPVEVKRWLLCALEVPPGYVATLAVEGSGWRLLTSLWCKNMRL